MSAIVIDNFWEDDEMLSPERVEINFDVEMEEIAINEQTTKRRREECGKNSKEVKKVKPRYELDWDEKMLCDGISAITCHKVITEGLCIHEVAFPNGQEYVPLVEVDIQSKIYNFKLDTFQKQATICISNNQSVLVSAHTSSGKTAVAEYAIAMCLQKNQRVIYTTPIKALSNQKFRDFSNEFQDVGLITGDTTINESASCLVMTTEILRSMLYEGSDITHEIGWVIFDEIHYMRDKERGYVWEESIILLSSSIKFVFLSATIPNARQFAKWICFTHDQPCNVVYTESRPTPLQHYVYPANSGELFRVVDTSGKFMDSNFCSALIPLQRGPGMCDLATARGEEKANAVFDCNKLVKAILDKDWKPVIVFSFSKKECENYASQTASQTLKKQKVINLTNKKEMDLINEVIQNALLLLSEENQNLFCIKKYIPYLKNGIGIHHSGLLPIIKELTELLFGEGLIKVLFATETFAMGLNMPARSVLFTSLHKFDGKVFRSITPGEYIQMSGRAGRRGKDKSGTVIMKLDERINPTIVKSLLTGNADPINSGFHLTYNMVLNTLRFDGTNPEHILKKSFFQFQNYEILPNIISDIKECNSKINSIKLKKMASIKTYHELGEKLKLLYNERHDYMIECIRFKTLLVHGRLVKVIHEGINFGWCALLDVSVNRKNNTGYSDQMLMVLMKVNEGPKKSTIEQESVIYDIKSLLPIKKITAGYPAITMIPPTSIWEISAAIAGLPKNILTSLPSRKLAIVLIDECIANFPTKNFIIDPVKDLDLKNEEFKKILQDIIDTNSALESHCIHNATNRNELLQKFKLRTETQMKLGQLMEKMEVTKGITYLSDLAQRKQALRKLGFMTESDVLTIKGRLACEISAGDEFLLVEMLFNGQFTDLDAYECCALLSTIVCTDKSIKPPQLKPNLAEPLRKLQDTAKIIGKILQLYNLKDDVQSYVDQFQSSLMEVTYYWCRGKSFATICKKTNIFAGNIVRMMKRLEVLLRQMINAATAIDMDEQAKTFTDGLKFLKRDIVSMDSLYI